MLHSIAILSGRIVRITMVSKRTVTVQFKCASIYWLSYLTVANLSLHGTFSIQKSINHTLNSIKCQFVCIDKVRRNNDER